MPQAATRQTDDIVRVQAPDGSIVEFPSHVPVEEMERAMQATFGGPNQPPASSANDDLPPGFHVVSQPDDLPAGFHVVPQDDDLPAGFRVVHQPNLVERALTPFENAAKAFLPGSQPSMTAQAEPAPEPSIVDTIMRGADYVDNTAAIGATGARRGFSTVLGLPVDAINNAPRLLNILPGVEGIGAISDKPFMGSEMIDQIMGAPSDVAAAGYNAATGASAPGREGPMPQDIVQRVAGRVGQEVGAAAVPIGAGLSLGARGVQAARELPSLGRLFAEPAAVAPARFVSKEVATATGAGIGGGIANEIVNPNTTGGQVTDLAGALIGASVTGIGSRLASGSKSIFDAVRRNPDYIDQVVKDAVVDRLGKAANIPGADAFKPTFDMDPLVSLIESSGRVRPSEVIPGYQESLADRTGNPGLAALEYGRQQGPSAGRFVARRSTNTEAVDAAISQYEPQATPGAFRDELDLERSRRLSDAELLRIIAEDDAGRAVQSLQPQTSTGQRGATIRTGLEDARDAARERTATAYETANVNGNMVDPSGLTRGLDEAVAGLTEVERGLVPQGMIDRVAALGRQDVQAATPTGLLDAQGQPIKRPAPPPEPVSLKEATDMRSELSRLRGAALADPRSEKGGRNAARVLSEMLDTVDNFIHSNISPDQRAALDAARGTKFDEAERFARQGDPVAAALARNEGGVPKMRDDQVAGSFVSPHAMNRLFTEADTPAVRQAIREEVLSRGDTSSAERIQRFTADYREQLDRFPGLREELDQAAAARTREAAARARETGLQRDLGTDTQRGRSSVGRYLEYGDENAEKAMSAVLASKDPAKAADELLTFINDKPQAVEGARAAFWKKLRSESQSVDSTARSMSGKRSWRGDWLKGFLDDPATSAVADRLYRDNPEHLASIKAIADVLDNADLRVRGKASASSGTSQGVSNILTPETLQSRMYAYMRGQISGTYLATSIGAVVARRAVRAARGDAIERLTDKALLDPDFAKGLLQENNPANRAAMARKAKGWLGNEASTFVNLMNEDEDDVKDAALRDAPKPVVEGNIDLMHRPVVENKDGTISTVKSMSINEDGQEILIPMISPSGTSLTEEGAIALYHRTGKHLGKFRSPDEANDFAARLHEQQERVYGR